MDEPTPDIPPPPPEITNAPLVPETLMTGRAWLDMTLGILTVVLSCLLPLLGALIALVVYFSIRTKYPVYARGILYGLAALAVLLLGAFTVCLFGIGALSLPH